MSGRRRSGPGWRRWALAGLVLLLLAGGAVAAVPSAGSGDSRLFVAGFTALRAGDGAEAADIFDRLLAVYPETPLRDLVLLFLARANLAAGNRQEAARAMANLLREYPGTPLAAAAGTELQALAAGFRRPVAAAKTVVRPGEHRPAPIRLAAEPHRRQDGVQERPAPERAAAAFELTVVAADLPRAVAAPIVIPLEIVNRGPYRDSYTLQSAFPQEFRATFSAGDQPGAPIGETPALAPGQRFAAVLSVVLPPTAVDGQRYVYPLRVASRRRPASDRISDVVLVAAAPLLRVVVRPDRPALTVGDRIDYAVTLLNVGSAPAEQVSLRFRCPGERLGAVTGIDDGGMVLTGVRLAPGEIRTGTVSFGLAAERPGGPELHCQAELHDDSRGMAEVFRAAAVRVAAP